ncbi:conserved hypothetical protein [Candidatus Desulfarcum epimagneticum]|uniref:Pterin-binding domain-containing protein n=1 Tax=uncultured Desulfobacteraceae bacterium TaxID=218296 RepID=A0A484HLG4_9BACT|nr:conserved hypothetical protein [uncultured Desulfobacteraceae bacterium]
MLLIGEKINGSIPKTRDIILRRDTGALVELAKTQARAGADYVDVNVATGAGSLSDESAAMSWAVDALRRETDFGLCIDSSDPDVMRAGLEKTDHRPVMINSVNAETDRLRNIIPLAVQYRATLIALLMDDDGIPKNPDGRIRSLDHILTACGNAGLETEKLYIDPLAIPISTDQRQAAVTLDTIKLIKKRYPDLKMVLGLSNISFGLPGRARINASFLTMAICHGVEAAILDTLEPELMSAIRTAEAIMGKDRHFRRYARSFRNKNKSK